MARNVNHIHRLKGGQQKEVITSTAAIIYSCFNYKMKSLGPKPLIKIHNNINLFDYQVDVIRRVYPDIDITLVVGEDADKIVFNRKDGVRIIENQLFAETNEVEYLRLALNANLASKVIVINGDIVFDLDHIRCFESNDGSTVLYDTRGKMHEEDVGIITVKNNVTSFAYKLEKKWTGMFSLVGDDIYEMSKLVNNKGRRRQFMFEPINTFLDRKMMLANEVGGTLIKIDSSKSLQEIPIENINK